jgi:hypothetical protein
MAKVIATGSTYHYREWLKRQGFKWEAHKKQWVTADVSIEEAEKIFAKGKEERLTLHVEMSKDEQQTETAKRIYPALNSTRGEVSSDSIYQADYAKENEPKPYARYLDETNDKKDDPF